MNLFYVFLLHLKKTEESNEEIEEILKRIVNLDLVIFNIDVIHW